MQPFPVTNPGEIRVGKNMINVTHPVVQLAGNQHIAEIRNAFACGTRTALLVAVVFAGQPDAASQVWRKRGFIHGGQ